MPTNIQGFQVLTKPNSTELESFPVFITIPQATTRIITFPTEFINSSTNPLSNLPASNFRSFSGMNIVSVEVQTGAAGSCLISGQMAALPKSAVQEVL